MDTARLVYRPKTEEERKRILERGEKLIGTPFQNLPGNPDSHVVLGEFDGHKIRVKDVEMVWNDRFLIDAVYGPEGEFYDAKIEPGTFQYFVLELAKKMYGERKQ